MRAIVKTLAQQVGTHEACELLAYPRSSYYRQQRPSMPQVQAENSSQAPSPRALSAAEQEKVRQTLNSDGLFQLSTFPAARERPIAH